MIMAKSLTIDDSFVNRRVDNRYKEKIKENIKKNGILNVRRYFLLCIL